MSYVITFLVGAWIGAALGVAAMCLLQVNQLAGKEGEHEKTDN